MVWLTIYVGTRICLLHGTKSFTVKLYIVLGVNSKSAVYLKKQQEVDFLSYIKIFY